MKKEYLKPTLDVISLVADSNIALDPGDPGYNMSGELPVGDNTLFGE